MTEVQASRDWLASTSSNVLACWIPHAALLVGLFLPIPFRVVMWTIALLWMGTACILKRGAAAARTAATPGLTIWR